MRVNLSGGDIHMTKHHLDRAKVCPPFQKMACKGVAEKMGGNPFTNARPLTIGFETLPEPLTAHPFP